MNITLFTSNQIRHNFLINELSKFSDNLNVIQECGTIFPGSNKGIYNKNNVIQKYFNNVKRAEEKIFSNRFSKINLKKNINLMTITFGDLNKIKLKNIKSFLRSDLYIVFGSSFIKGNLFMFLKKKSAINIHMGISPFYKGTDCNFWAIIDGNYDKVGGTIQYLDKNIDNGKILYHAISQEISDPFLYSMSTVKSAIKSLKPRVLNKDIKKIKSYKNTFPTFRISKKKDFTTKIIKKIYKIKIFKKNRSLGDLINPYILKKNIL